MEITEIKQKLEITEVARHLGIKLNKANKAPARSDPIADLQSVWT